MEIRHAMEAEWDAGDRARYARELSSIPSAGDFPSWIAGTVRAHRSNVTHPLFAFLRDEATFEQTREFLFQETPLEVLFGDIIALLLPGVYGEPKLEIAKNFWDEVGRAEDARVHRNMRFRMMSHFNIPSDAHVRYMDGLVVEELRLINSYLMTATNRAKLLQLVGMLLVTETMIPGRFEHQILGCRRLGLNDEQMSYLLEHTTVDGEHADGWLKCVVEPILKFRPEAVYDLTVGALRRLSAAEGVCDRMMSHLRSDPAHFATAAFPKH
jgi:hypothetical protein